MMNLNKEKSLNKSQHIQPLELTPDPISSRNEWNINKRNSLGDKETFNPFSPKNDFRQREIDKLSNADGENNFVAMLSGDTRKATHELKEQSRSLSRTLLNPFTSPDNGKYML